MRFYSHLVYCVSAAMLSLCGCVGFIAEGDLRAALDSKDADVAAHPISNESSRDEDSNSQFLGSNSRDIISDSPRRKSEFGETRPYYPLTGTGENRSHVTGNERYQRTEPSSLRSDRDREYLREDQQSIREKDYYDRELEYGHRTELQRSRRNQFSSNDRGSDAHEGHLHLAGHNDVSDQATSAKIKNSIPDSWDERLQLAIEALERRVDRLPRQKDNSVERSKLEAQLRLLYFVANDRENAVSPIESFRGAEREFWKELVFSLIVYFDEETPKDVQRRTLALHNLRRATDLLSTVSNLEVHNVRFCSRVDSFGRFSEIKKYEFLPDAELLLYVEIENFTAEQTESGEYETALLGHYDVYDAAGRRVGGRPFVVEKEVCRNRRRDFFIPYRIYMPDQPPGKYTLQLTIQDVKSKRSGQSAPISFTIKR